MATEHDSGSRGTSMRDVERAVLSRIAGGDLAIGGRLPSCEQLGRELGANKNTVSKAYQALARRGYLASHPGRGTFVVRRPRDEDRPEAVAEIVKILRSASEQADLSGLSLDEFSGLALQTARRYFDRVKLRIGYVDGTRVDARRLGRQLQTAVSAPIEPLVVEEVVKNAEEIAVRFDILAVNMSHLGVVERHLRRVGSVSRAEVVPILSLPDPETMTQVARLAPGTHLAIIVETEDTLPVLIGLTRSFNPSVEIDAMLASSRAVTQTLERAEVVMITSEAEIHLGHLKLPIPTIEAGFKVDEQSTTALLERIASRTRENENERAPAGSTALASTLARRALVKSSRTPIGPAEDPGGSAQ